MGLLSVGTSVSLIFVPALGTLFLLLGCHVNIMMVLLYLICYFCPVWLLSPRSRCSFLMRDKKGIDLEGSEGGEDLGRVEGGKTTIGIYCIRKDYFQ